MQKGKKGKNLADRLRDLWWDVWDECLPFEMAVANLQEPPTLPYSEEQLRAMRNSLNYILQAVDDAISVAQEEGIE